MPFFCVSSDLTDASMFVHRSGSLLDAVTASSSPPAVMVPTRLGDHLLCDGSLFNTLPVDLAREFGCGTLVASRVSVPQDKDFLFAQIPTLGQVIRHTVTRRPIRYPGIMSVLLRSSMIAAVGRENRESLNADLLFAPRSSSTDSWSSGRCPRSSMSATPSPGRSSMSGGEQVV